jgi:hypothetical protein
LGGFDCNASTDSLIAFIENAVAPGATAHTDGWQAYWTVPQRGYEHERTIVRAQPDPAHLVTPRVPPVASLLKRWLRRNPPGVGRTRASRRLPERVTFRFNRRGLRRRRMLLYRLLR